MHLRADCLVYFIDETGHEEFCDPKYPIFGLGGCAVFAGMVDELIRNPWRLIKKQYFGSEDFLLHASGTKMTMPQIEAITNFFRKQPIGRFAATFTHRTKLSGKLSTIEIMPGVLRKRFVEIFERCNPIPSEIAIIHEASERGDRLIEKYFGETVVNVDGHKLKVDHAFMSKGDEALEVADFIIHTAGCQTKSWLSSADIRKDFKAVFHSNPLWSSFIMAEELVP